MAAMAAIVTILATFNLLPDTSYKVSNQLAFRFGGRSSKYIFKWRPFRISDRNDFSRPDTSYQKRKSTSFIIR